MLGALLALRLRDVETVTLPRLVRGDPALRRASPGLAQAMFQNRDRIREGLSTETSRRAFASRLTEGMLRYLTHGYQYIDIAGVRRPALEAAYMMFVDGLSETAGNDSRTNLIHALESVLRSHHERLRQWVTAELVAVGASAAVSRGVVPVCAQYSPEAQLAVLGIEPGSVSGPILDLGCGEEGLLVQALRSMGHEVVGIDQNAARPDLLRGSWFEAPLPPGNWSLVIAHQSFSLHLLQAHLQSEQRATRYVRLYMAILGALRIGGRFAYAPNLPFLESLLPIGRFRVRIKAGPPERLAQAPKPMRTLYRTAGLGSAIVERTG